MQGATIAVSQDNSANHNEASELRKAKRNRRDALRALYITNHETISTAAYEAYPGLIVWGHARIMERLAGKIRQYSGPLEQFQSWAVEYVQSEAKRAQQLVSLLERNREEISRIITEEHPVIHPNDHDNCLSDLPFTHTGKVSLAGLKSFARTEAQRRRTAAEILAEHEKVIRAAIRAALFGKSKDCAVDVEDVFADVSTLIYRYALSLENKAQAKLSTRLYGLAHRHTINYYTRNRSAQYRLIEKLRWSAFEGWGKRDVLSEEELAELRAIENAEVAA